MEEFNAVNWTAIIVGTIAAFVLGMIWFNQKVFGKKWAEGSNVPEDKEVNMVLAMGANIIGLFLLALVVGFTQTTEALLTALAAIFSLAIFTASMGAFAKKSTYAIMVDFGYVVVAGGLMILAQGIFSM
ncbi:MAG: DUF1761 domain-containing protein [Rhizobiales bacterium]|nr:DUF1761 domain-containing protein [Hyphomicrobiales bacterium]NRB14458.1 DUF1761 domain-containing protein [Hyphomicrobiales bacterium]